MKKLAVVFLCFSLLLTAISCTPTSNPPSQDTYEKQKTLYNNIIVRYTSLLTAKHNGEVLTAPNTDGMDERESAIAKALHTIVDVCESVESLGYGYKDMDGNGTPELFLLTRPTYIRAVFTISDGKPILLEANYAEDYTFFFAPNNRLFLIRDNRNDHIEEVTYYTCRVDGDKMAYDAIFGEVYDWDKWETLEIFQIMDGVRAPIDRDTFNDLHREYKKINATENYTGSKLLTPRIYFPLNSDVGGENLPVADFSSYAAIRETYGKIANCLDSFNATAWIGGRYDDLFSFPSDLSFEYYIRLLYAAYHGSYRVGYDEIDLNGDGKDELVLLDEDYRIKAIFTQKDGVPVLLGAFANETCWLDDQAFIHVDREEHYELEYSLYEFTKGGEYRLVYSILADNNGKHYLTKDGKTVAMSPEESMAYYDDYRRYSEPFAPNEQTRNVSALTYTPLSKEAEDPIGAATAKSWTKSAKLEKSTGKYLANSVTHVTFENVTDTQAQINIKYRFTYYYPDPDNENYFLSDTAESTLKLTALKENGALVFDEHGIKGRVEFGHKYLWLIIGESADRRFAVGYHCYEQYSSQK